MNDRITIQIDDKEYKTTRQTISKSAFLNKLFESEELANVLIDKNKDDFELILSFLRNPTHESIPFDKEYLYDEYEIEKAKFLLRAPTCFMCIFYIFIVLLLLIFINVTFYP